MQERFKEYEVYFNESIKLMDEMEKRQDILDEIKYEIEKEYGSWTLISKARKRKLVKEAEDHQKAWQVVINQGERLQKEFAKRIDDYMGSTF